MRILISGGTGFIGSHIQDEYIRQGHTVAVLDNQSNSSQKYLHPKANIYKVDIRSEEVRQVFRDFQPELVNHHAAQTNVRKSIDNPGFDAQVNVLGTLNLLEAAKDQAVKKFIFASSGGALYGEESVFPTDENQKLAPISPYGISKLSAEKYLRFYAEQYNFDWVILRYANVYGPRQNVSGEAGVIAIFIDMMMREELPVIFGNGEQTRDFVFVDDVARANLLALSSKVTGVYNIGTECETSVKDLYVLLAQELDFKHAPQYRMASPGELLRSVLSYRKFHSVSEWVPRVDIVTGIKKTIAFFEGLYE